MSNRKTQFDLLIQIYTNCVDLNLNVLRNINDEQLIWKPGAESRSIAEIARHVLRVDNMLLNKIDIEAKVEDPSSNDNELIQLKLNEQKNYVISLIQLAGSNEQLSKVKKKEGSNELSLRSTVIHLINHHLYHYAQMVYLRRVQDRNWEAPLKKWESTVDLIAEL